MGEGAAVRFDGLDVAYGRESVLRGVDGAVAAGRTLALVGPNGAGKTTLLRAVLGLARASSGAITVLGSPPERARRHVAYMPQADTLDPDFPVSAVQVVLMGRYRELGWLRRPRRADREIAADCLAQVGLPDLAGRRFGLLSGGQRQRVLLARAIAQRPRLLLLDEPFSGVDGVSRQALLTALSALTANGAAAVLSTHDIALAGDYCDDVCLLNGRQYGFGPAAEVLTADRLRAAYGHRFLDVGAVVGE